MHQSFLYLLSSATNLYLSTVEPTIPDQTNHINILYIVELVTHRANWDKLVGVVHHGDEEIEQDDDVDDGEGAEHDEAPEPCELLDPGQLEVVQVDQAKGGPKQGLTCFPKTESKNMKLNKKNLVIMSTNVNVRKS